VTEDVIVIDGPPTYGRTPRELLRNPNVSPQAKALWGLLEDFASPSRPQPFPGQATLAEYMGVTDRSIRTWMTELQEAGWLQVQREPTKKGRRNSYRLFWKHTSEPATVSDEDRKQTSGGKRKQSSGTYRKHTSYEEKPCEAEPVEEENPAATVGEQVELFRNPRAEPAVPAGSPAVAKLMLDDWWQQQDPKPQQPYVAVLQVLRKALKDGWHERDLRDALDSVPIISGGALDYWRKQRTRPTVAWAPGGKTGSQRTEESLERIHRTMGLA
jgi:hypothetical protein